MKKLNKISLTILTVVALVTSSVMADELFFKDTFSNSEAVGNSINYNSYVYDRQFGTKAPMNYYVNAAQNLILGGKVWVTNGGGGTIQTLYDYTDSLNFNVDCDITYPVPADGAEQYSTIGLFKTVAHQFAPAFVLLTNVTPFTITSATLLTTTAWVYVFNESIPVSALDNHELIAIPESLVEISTLSKEAVERAAAAPP